MYKNVRTWSLFVSCSGLKFHVYVFIYDLYSKVVWRLLENQMNTGPLTSGGVKKSVVEHLYYSLIRKSGSKKLKLLPCLSHERGSRRKSPLSLKHCARWWRMINITPRPLSSPRNNPGSYWIGDVDGRIILRWIFRKWEGVVGTGWSWLRIGTGGGRLWVRWGTFGFRKCGEFLD